MLQIESVSKRFRDGTQAVRNLSLAVEGGVLGLVGPNGAGKTTLMQMIATVTRPTAGRILFDEEDVVQRPDGLRRRLGFLPQDFGVYDNLTARELLSYFAALKGVHDRGAVERMLELVNLHAVADRAVGGFSGGMKQRLGIAQALINDPDLVIVDEPTAGLDPEERVRFRNVLSEVGFGKLVILSTHIVSDIESVATRIAVMDRGELLALETPEAGPSSEASACASATARCSGRSATDGEAHRRSSSLTPTARRWDDPTVTTKADSKKRIVLPRAKPGEIYDVQELDEGQYLLVRLERPEPKASPDRRQCLRAMDERPLRVGVSWDELRRMTREP